MSNGSIVRATRVHLKLSQSHFAELLGVHAMTVSKWERDKLEPPRWYKGIMSVLTSVDVTGVDVEHHMVMFGPIATLCTLFKLYVAN